MVRLAWREATWLDRGRQRSAWRDVPQVKSSLTSLPTGRPNEATDVTWSENLTQKIGVANKQEFHTGIFMLCLLHLRRRADYKPERCSVQYNC
nr:hypothetical protein CFP56_55317 [Quercus suber]